MRWEAVTQGTVNMTAQDLALDHLVQRCNCLFTNNSQSGQVANNNISQLANQQEELATPLNGANGVKQNKSSLKTAAPLCKRTITKCTEYLFAVTHKANKFK